MIDTCYVNIEKMIQTLIFIIAQSKWNDILSGK